MAASEAQVGLGATFARRTSAAGVTPKVWTEIGEAVSITPANPSRESVDVTHLKSPNGTREHKPTLREPGELSVTFNYTPELRAILEDMFMDGDIDELQTTFPDGSTETAAGFLTSMPTDAIEVDGVMRMSCTFKLTGLPVFQPGA